jgi:hypothetical protein
MKPFIPEPENKYETVKLLLHVIYSCTKKIEEVVEEMKEEK